ncbi:uncharacterized [Tachysurus ichikawai]
MSIKLAQHKGASRLSAKANGGPVVYCAVLLASKPGKYDTGDAPKGDHRGSACCCKKKKYEADFLCRRCFSWKPHAANTHWEHTCFQTAESRHRDETWPEMLAFIRKPLRFPVTATMIHHLPADENKLCSRRGRTMAAPYALILLHHDRNTIPFKSTPTPPLAYTSAWCIWSIVFSFTHDSGCRSGQVMEDDCCGTSIRGTRTMCKQWDWMPRCFSMDEDAKHKASQLIIVASV